MLRILRITGIVFLVALSACHPVPQQAVTEKKEPVEGLVFLTFNMRADSISGKAVNLTNKTIVHQKLKSDPHNSEMANRLWISQLTSSGQKLSSVAIDHPLFKRVEFADDRGQFHSKELTLKEAEFFVRVTLYGQTEYIQVEEELAGKIAYSVKFNLRN